MADNQQQNINIKNKKSSHEYEFLEKFIAGIQLTGTEIKSIRAGKASLVDSYCYFHNGELFLKGMHVSEYWWGTYNNHEPKRDRKLLLTKKELIKLQRKSAEKGLTIIAIRLFVNERGLAKLEIALARGKQDFDKREDIKKRDHKREMDRAMKI
jgi:SsrA-binding protein